MSGALLIRADEYWANGWHGPTAFRVSDGMLRLDVVADASTPSHIDAELPGTVFAGLTDHHVHIGLVDGAALVPAGITDAIDLGWVPQVASTWLDQAPAGTDALPSMRIAGAFLTCVGGYPAASVWAPEGAVVQLTSVEHAACAVAEQHAAGASVIKVVLNCDAGPVLGDDLLAAVVSAAHAHDLPVVAHVEGAGQTARAAAAHVDALAHSPFSERVEDAGIERMAAAGTVWISTLDIHGWGEHSTEFDIAVDNVRRFHQAGGRIVYGTDLGNGPLPVGVNQRELAALASAGLGADELVASIAGSAEPETLGPVFAWVPGTPPATADAVAGWLAGARGGTIDMIQEGAR